MDRVFGGLVATGLQIWQLTQLPFFPGSSGYASCFIGWAVMNIIMLLAGTYWMETTLARSLRHALGRREGLTSWLPRRARSSGPTCPPAPTSGASSPSGARFSG